MSKVILLLLFGAVFSLMIGYFKLALFLFGLLVLLFIILSITTTGSCDDKKE